MDGTGNQIGDSETNIVKFYRSLSQDEEQLTHYIMGVGTNDSPSLIMRPLQKFYAVLGFAFGLGLEDDVLKAYRWLCRNYVSADHRLEDWKNKHPHKKPTEWFQDDQIYVLGFSRGSYAARVLTGFINNFGLVSENDLHLVTPAFRAYRSLTQRDHKDPASVRYKALRQFQAVMRPDHVPIRALALFDTVASMIRLDWPWYTIPKYWSLADLGLHANVESNPSVRIVVHAMAVDERRTFFRNLPWKKGEPYFGNPFRNPSQERKQYVTQRWFSGFHGDIGGSSREDEAGIGKITALWLLQALEDAEKAADAEDLPHLNEKRAKLELEPLAEIPTNTLTFRRFNLDRYFRGEDKGPGKATNAGGYRYSAPDPYAPIHPTVFSNGWIPSLSWIWFILELIPPKARLRAATKKPAWFRRLWPYYIPLMEPRFIPDDDEVDDSVFMRRDDPNTEYDPVNMTRPTPVDVNAWWEQDGD